MFFLRFSRTRGVPLEVPRTVFCFVGMVIISQERFFFFFKCFFSSWICDSKTSLFVF